jgi:hypothetical protein
VRISSFERILSEGALLLDASVVEKEVESNVTVGTLALSRVFQAVGSDAEEESSVTSKTTNRTLSVVL